MMVLPLLQRPMAPRLLARMSSLKNNNDGLVPTAKPQIITQKTYRSPFHDSKSASRPPYLALSQFMVELLHQTHLQLSSNMPVVLR